MTETIFKLQPHMVNLYILFSIFFQINLFVVSVYEYTINEYYETQNFIFFEKVQMNFRFMAQYIETEWR